jgi:putative glutamine amidotransferase
MSRPVIGLSTYFEPAEWGLWSIEAALIPRWYLDVFGEAGADILLVPPGTSADVLSRVDGLVIAGGADVDARLYGEAAHETADAPREARDATEMALYRGARERNLPFLGICRGAQIMSVAQGGALHQHLPDITEVEHKRAPLVFVEHTARLEPNSRIATIFGSERITVNSFHHQAIKDAGDLVVTGWAPDDTVEVVEMPQAKFAVGVQWHPEHPDRRILDRPLIDAFLDACRA